MFLFRVLLPILALAAGGLALAWWITKDRRYLTYLVRLVQGVLLLAVAFGLLYAFQRILLL